MKITPMASPTAPQAAQQAPAADKRAAAIAAFNKGAQPQQGTTVQNATSIQPEEMSAIGSEIKHSPISEVSEETAVETQAVETPKAEDPALSRQFAQLARQEKQLRLKAQQQEQAIKAREEALAAREAQLTQQPQIDTTKYISRDQLKQDALSALAEAGVTYEELTQQVINQQPRDPRIESTIQRLNDKIAALEKQNEQSQKTYQEQQTAAYQAAVKQIETDVKNLVNTDPAFEAIKASRATKDVVQLIEETYKQDGILLSVEEAAQQVEEYLVEEYTKLTNIGKIKQRMAQASAQRTLNAPMKTQGTPQTKQPQPMKTLTNATSSSRQLSAKERAILAFKGELKS